MLQELIPTNNLAIHRNKRKQSNNNKQIHHKEWVLEKNKNSLPWREFFLFNLGSKSSLLTSLQSEWKTKYEVNVLCEKMMSSFSQKRGFYSIPLRCPLNLPLECVSRHLRSVTDESLFSFSKLKPSFKLLPSSSRLRQMSQLRHCFRLLLLPVETFVSGETKSVHINALFNCHV